MEPKLFRLILLLVCMTMSLTTLFGLSHWEWEYQILYTLRTGESIILYVIIILGMIFIEKEFK